MKTHVIQLEPHDDVISIRDKMAWAKTGRILLVFPPRPGSHLLTLDLRLLQRQANRLGAQLAVVTRSPLLKDISAALGLPVFPNPSTAQRADWQAVHVPQAPARRRPPPDLRGMRLALADPEAAWRARPAVRLGVFSLAVLALLFVLLSLLPSATIVLSPATQLQSLTLPVSASLEVQAVSLTGSLPARLTSIVLERSGTTPASGTLALPVAHATGVVRFENLTTALVGLPSGTVLRTTGVPAVRFVTTADAVLEAGVGKRIEVPVRALQPGPLGNLPAGALVAFESDLGTSLAVTNLQPTTGGSERPASVQTAEDRERLRAALLLELETACRSALPESLALDDLFFPDTLMIAQVLTESYFPAEDQAGESLSLTLSVRCQALYAAAADIQSLAVLTLDATLPSGFEPVSAGAAVLSVGQPVTDEQGFTHFEVQVQRLLRTAIDTDRLVRLALGRPVREIETRWNAELPLETAPDVQMTPSFWPWMPVVPSRIQIVEGG